MDKIQLLDCTLRDGGHVNQGQFGKTVITAIIQELVKAKVDIIEVGFLCEYETEEDTAKFKSVSELKKYLPMDMGHSKVALMADNVDLSNLELYDGTVEYIRLSFRKNEFAWAEKTAKLLKDKGYKCFINPIHGSALTDEEYLNIINRVNKIRPYGFSIVDTFGAMRKADIGRIYYLIEHNLNKEITLGIHLHENLGLSYSLAQYILNIVVPTRNIIIDGSLYGMGKVPGNLCIEHMIDYMNNEYHANYSIEPVYDAIDEYIIPIYERFRWGYSIPYAISGQCSVHRTYAEYLCQKDRLKSKDIRRILNSLLPEKAEIFDEKYIDEVYQKYIDVAFDDSNYLSGFEKFLNNYKKIVIIDPGTSIKDYVFDENLIGESCVISVNFVFNQSKVDLCFFTSPKRIGLVSQSDYDKMVITSNLYDEEKNPEYIISRNELVYHEDIYCDDATLMLLNLLKRMGKREIYIAGFDGYKRGKNNYYTQVMERSIREDYFDIESKIAILKESYLTLNLHFLTPSVYESALEGEI